MEKPEIKQKLVIEPNQVMIGFCWSYTKALLDKLIALGKEDRIFKKGARATQIDEKAGFTSDLTDIAFVLISAIRTQINTPGDISNPSTVLKLIKVCQEFLDIFKKENHALPIHVEF